MRRRSGELLRCRWVPEGWGGVRGVIGVLRRAGRLRRSGMRWQRMLRVRLRICERCRCLSGGAVMCTSPLSCFVRWLLLMLMLMLAGCGGGSATGAGGSGGATNTAPHLCLANVCPSSACPTGAFDVCQGGDTIVPCCQSGACFPACARAAGILSRACDSSCTSGLCATTFGLMQTCCDPVSSTTDPCGKVTS